ncbi:hypothetical protein [Dictyobacter kobayashii]|uniref:Uncharacterized protein n=1 Tax=Dictyobacter kobayashii TaxID=2014872 RepID=A0A402AQB7_9CHLR|nr:hypothetical protein [Dictyobacter kobayashii]GCE21244.1 hypothetical protein KDK_50440 [Dictyobacter kobayashii]
MCTGNLRIYYRLIALCLLLILAVLGSMFKTGTAQAHSQPMIQVLAYDHEFDANNCTVATVVARGFQTSSLFLSATATLGMIGSATLTVTPPLVQLGVDGNFDVKATLCYPHTPLERLVQITDLQITATDSRSGVQATSEPLNITDPQPTINVLQTSVPQLAGCATVVVLGNDFLASRLAENDVAIQGSTDDSGQPLTVSPPHVNVLGGGNIAISTQFCGLAPKESFNIQVVDNGSLYSSNQLLIHTI